MLDYRKSKTDPTVAYIDVEMETDQQVAKSFKDFVKQLEYNREFLSDVDEDDFLPVEDEIYNEKQLEEAVKSWSDPAMITDTFFYFSSKETICDINWLISQAIVACHHHDDPFFVDGIVAYTYKRMTFTDKNVLNKELVDQFKGKIRQYPEEFVCKYAEKIEDIFSA